jgi:hypothetical protein
MPFIQGQQYAHSIMELHEENPGVNMAREIDGVFTIIPSTAKPVVKNLAMVNGVLQEVTDENLVDYEKHLENTNDYVVNFHHHWNQLSDSEKNELGGDLYLAYKKAVESHLQLLEMHKQIKNRKKFIVI